MHGIFPAESTSGISRMTSIGKGTKTYFKVRSTATFAYCSGATHLKSPAWFECYRRCAANAAGRKH